MTRSLRVVILLLGVLSVAAVAAAAAYMIFSKRPGPQIERTTGAADVGGPFALVDQNGEAVTEETYRGKVMVVTFGYTFCPDMCPTTLAMLGQALDRLGPEAKDVQPIFITVDPERDTPEVLAAYVPHFHPSLVGLTGSPEAIAAVAKAYKVFYAKAGDTESSETYLMDHSTVTYIMDRDGRYAAFLSHGADPETMAARIREVL